MRHNHRRMKHKMCFLCLCVCYRRHREHRLRYHRPATTTIRDCLREMIAEVIPSCPHLPVIIFDNAAPGPPSPAWCWCWSLCRCPRPALLLLRRRLFSCGNSCVHGFDIDIATTTFFDAAVDGGINGDGNNDRIFTVGDDVVLMVLSKLTTTISAAAADAVGGC